MTVPTFGLVMVYPVVTEPGTAYYLGDGLVMVHPVVTQPGTAYHYLGDGKMPLVGVFWGRLDIGVEI
jgi:hypothetical protein